MENKERIPGGMAHGKNPSDFDPADLAEGIAVEMEHTSDKEVAREIALDHLVEDPSYYKKLKIMEDLSHGELNACKEAKKAMMTEKEIACLDRVENAAKKSLPLEALTKSYWASPEYETASTIDQIRKSDLIQ